MNLDCEGSKMLGNSCQGSQAWLQPLVARAQHTELQQISVSSFANAPIWFRQSVFERPIEPLSFENVEALSFADLPALLRSLVAGDGMVTKVLEAYFWEPIQIKVVSQCHTQPASALPMLSVSADERMIMRYVYLQGQHTHTVYCYATSWFNPCALPDSVAAELAVENNIDEITVPGIGALLSQYACTTHRQTLRIGLQQFQPPGELQTPVQLVYRSYQVAVQAVRAILITESFPLEVYS